MTNFTYNESESYIKTEDGEQYNLNSQEAFNIISKAWLRVGWDTKYVYGFSWLGRPIIQLPEDLIRIQELIYEIKPDYIIETGVAHGGSLVFYSSLLQTIGKGKVIGIDIDIREHNKKAIANHELSNYITLIEGNSTSNEVLYRLKNLVDKEKKIIVVLDSNHSKDHVLKELYLYSEFVSKGSFIIACDGIMKQVKGAPRTQDDWDWNNPLSAIDQFLHENKEFYICEPNRPFNEGNIKERVTYWPNAYLRKKI